MNFSKIEDINYMLSKTLIDFKQLQDMFNKIVKNTHTITPEARDLTAVILFRLRAILDHIWVDVKTNNSCRNFPVINKTSDFDKKVGNIDNNIKNIIKEIQPFNTHNSSWLFWLHKLNNANKHEFYIKQKIDKGPQGFSIEDMCSDASATFLGCKFEGKVKIGIGKNMIQIDTAKQLPIPCDGVKIESKQIVFIRFDINNISDNDLKTIPTQEINVISLIQNAYNEIKRFFECLTKINQN